MIVRERKDSRERIPPEQLVDARAMDRCEQGRGRREVGAGVEIENSILNRCYLRCLMTSR